MSIDWTSFLDTYNRMTKSDYETPKEMIECVYRECNYFTNPFAEIFGISHGSARKKLKEMGIFRQQPSGGNNHKDRPPGKKELAFLNIRPDVMEDLTKDQVCERIGCSQTRVSTLIRKHQRRYRTPEKDGIRL
jgi:hypothetical protein